MEATAPPNQRRSPAAALSRLDFDLVSTWLLGFGVVLYLGLKGGGFDPLVGDKVGIVVWWVVLAGLVVGAFPRRRLGAAGWSGLALLAAFLGWTALSLAWTESHANTSAEIARVATYLGVFALALSIRGSRSIRPMLAAVGTAIAAIALIGLLSRLHPAWFPEAAQTAQFLPGVRDRLSYPIGYWNAIAALIAIGLPLLLEMATSGRSVLLRALAAAALPAMILTIYFTLSRGGILAATIAFVAYISLAGDRVPRLATAAVAAIGGAVLIGATSQRAALQEGLLSATAHHQGNEVLWMTVAVCLIVGLIGAALSLVLLRGRRPAWSVPSRRAAIATTAAAAIVVAIAAIGINLPQRVSDGVTEFKSGAVATGGAGRLTSAAGEQRYELWESALDEFRAEPLHGTGAGTFEFWWARNGKYAQAVRDTHSLYLQTLGELGLVGILLLGGFLIAILAAAAAAIRRLGDDTRPSLAAALAGVLAFLVCAALDWVWQVPVVPVAMLLLAAALVTAGVRSDARRSAHIPPLLRAGLALLAIVAMIGIAIPLSATTLLRESEAQVREGDLTAALDSAQSAANVQPDSARPRLQQALILEKAGAYSTAARQARAATELEPLNWKSWLILSRVQAEAGDARAAVDSYRRAASLNPNSPLFLP
jgi:hypothetical protein